MLLPRATNAFARARSGLTRAAPYIHTVRKVTDAAGSLARTPGLNMIPGAGLVSTISKAVGAVDNAAQKLARA